VSPKKRPSLAEIANIASEAVSNSKREPARPEESVMVTTPQPEPEQAAPPPIFKKFTAPFREEQLDQLSILLASWTASKRVKFSAAEVLRLGLDKVLHLMEENPEQAIVELYQQEQQEMAASETRKFGRSKGAKEYLRKAGKL
jgi:hypothetical protein